MGWQGGLGPEPVITNARMDGAAADGDTAGSRAGDAGSGQVCKARRFQAARQGQQALSVAAAGTLCAQRVEQKQPPQGRSRVACPVAPGAVDNSPVLLGKVTGAPGAQNRGFPVGSRGVGAGPSWSETLWVQLCQLDGSLFATSIFKLHLHTRSHPTSAQRVHTLSSLQSAMQTNPACRPPAQASCSGQ